MAGKNDHLWQEALKRTMASIRYLLFPREKSAATTIANSAIILFRHFDNRFRCSHYNPLLSIDVYAYQYIFKRRKS